MSMNPGATTLPATSIRRLACAPERLPIAAIRPSRMPTSPEYQGEPVPSTMRPCSRTRSNGASAWRAGARRRKSAMEIFFMISALSRLLPELDAAEHAGDVLDDLHVFRQLEIDLLRVAAAEVEDAV